MNVLLKDCWVGSYVGSGHFEGGSCPDILITNVPEIKDLSYINQEYFDDLFRYYLDVLCSWTGHDKQEYDFEIDPKDIGSPVVITKREDLEDCSLNYIQVDYKDLEKWYFNEDEDEEDEDPFEVDWE